MRLSGNRPKTIDSSDPFFLERVAGDPRFNQPDRLHPTVKGYCRIVDHIHPYVLNVIK